MTSVSPRSTQKEDFGFKTKVDKNVRRVLTVRLNNDKTCRLYEVVGTSKDGEGSSWLDGVITFLSHNDLNFPQRVCDAFSKTSRCGIDGCENLVEVGAHVTIDGKGLIILPTCQKHNRNKRMMRGMNFRLKEYQVYAEISLAPGKEMVANEDSDSYFLQDETLFGGLFDTLTIAI